ncbi:hypothetical protein PG985_010279 [Apiospora marii]|uniref:Uncharacterized protein n=1 Tax=Apiospora marii TaxID=335849 RepID=A0ABR1RLF8_9PEZI
MTWLPTPWTRTDLDDKLGALDFRAELRAHVVARGAAQLGAAGAGTAEVVDLGAIRVGANGDGHRAAGRVVPNGLAAEQVVGALRVAAAVRGRVCGEHGAGRVESSGDDAVRVDGQAGGGKAEHGEAEEVDADEEDGLEHLGGEGKLDVDLRSSFESGDKSGM